MRRIDRSTASQPQASIRRVSLVLMLACVLSLFPCPINPQPTDPTFHSVVAENDLSQGTVKCIYQDRRGFLWIGTQDGLNKYDGYSFTVFRHDEDDPTSLSNNSIATIYEDRAGRVWVGTSGGGLNLMDWATGKFLRYRSNPDDPATLSDDGVDFVVEDAQGSLWIGTQSGLNLFDPGSGVFTRFGHDASDPSSLSDSSVRSAAADEDGGLWLGTRSGGLIHFDTRTRLSTTYNTGAFAKLREQPLIGLCLTKDKMLWIGTEGGGLFSFDTQTSSLGVYQNDPQDPSSLPGITVEAFYELEPGILLLAMNGGLVRFDTRNRRFEKFRWSLENPAAPEGNLRCFYRDRSGILWIGADGLTKLDLRRPKFMTVRNIPSDDGSLSSGHVFAFTEDSSGGFWVGIAGTGVNYLDPKTGRFSHYRHIPSDPNSLSDDRVFSFVEDENGAMWVGTSGGGLNRLDRTTGKFTNYKYDPSDADGLSNNKVWVSLKDRNGQLWFATQDGINKFDATTEKFIRFQNDPANANSLAAGDVRAMIEDPDGTFWVGTRNHGLDKFDPATGTFTHFRHNENDPTSLIGDNVYSLHKDFSNQLWVGTTAGLSKLNSDNRTFTHFNDDDGLPNNTIYGILSDRSGNIWVSTNNGIAKIDPENRRSRNYTAADGLQDKEFDGGAAYRSESGEMFFGGPNGYNQFHPDEVRESDYEAPLVFTNFKRFEEKAGLDRSPEAVEKLEFSYQDSLISIEFASLDFTNPENNRYAYKLEGFDEDWIQSGTRHVAYYTNLDGGDYVFKVRGTNSDGVWSKNEAAIRLTILPPFWKTWWFYSLAAIVLIGMAFFLYRKRVNKLHAARAAQEEFSRNLISAQENERRRIAAELHDSLGQSLAMIKNSSVFASESATDLSTAREQFASITDQSANAIREVREIAYNLRPHLLDRLGLTKALSSMLKKIADDAQFDLEFEVGNIDGVFANAVEINAYRIVQEALTNVAKHSGATRARVSVKDDGGLFTIRIEDNGKGFEVDSPGNGKGRVGFGLMGLAERARILGGTLSINSRPGDGTRIVVEVERNGDVGG